MKNIGIVINPKRASRSHDTLNELRNLAQKNSVDLFMYQKDIAEILGAKYIPYDDFIKSMNIVFAMGGDGTVLYAATKLIGTGIPVLGINLGSLGFLAGVGEYELEHAFKRILNKDYVILDRDIGLLSAHSKNVDQENIPFLNDIVIGWGSSSRINTLELEVDSESVGIFTCDGMIVSTPTGSTGHSLSNGGPIMHPNIQGFGISVICPHTLSTRPLIIPNNSAIVIKVKYAVKDLLLSIDGHDLQNLNEGDYIKIVKHNKIVNFIQLEGHSYFKTLTNKLNWRGSVI